MKHNNYQAKWLVYMFICMHMMQLALSSSVGMQSREHSPIIVTLAQRAAQLSTVPECVHHHYV